MAASGMIIDLTGIDDEAPVLPISISNDSQTAPTPAEVPLAIAPPDPYMNPQRAAALILPSDTDTDEMASVSSPRTYHGRIENLNFDFEILKKRRSKPKRQTTPDFRSISDQFGNMNHFCPKFDFANQGYTFTDEQYRAAWAHAVCLRAEKLAINHIIRNMPSTEDVERDPGGWIMAEFAEQLQAVVDRIYDIALNTRAVRAVKHEGRRSKQAKKAKARASAAALEIKFPIREGKRERESTSHEDENQRKRRNWSMEPALGYAISD